jgi:hypothetical protein
MLVSGRENPDEMFSEFKFPTETLLRILSMRLELVYVTVKYSKKTNCTVLELAMKIHAVNLLTALHKRLEYEERLQGPQHY